MWAIWLDAIFAKKSAQFLQRHESVVHYVAKFKILSSFCQLFSFPDQIS